MMLGPEAFGGVWKLARRIDDRLAGQEGVLSGQVEMTPAGLLRLAYVETGEFRLGRGPAMQATRRYNWQFTASEVVVTFEDGSAFHKFTPQGCAAGSDHPCGDDYYKVAYDFTRWPNWEAIWTVLGPRKDYTSVSRYIRA